MFAQLGGAELRFVAQNLSSHSNNGVCRAGAALPQVRDVVKAKGQRFIVGARIPGD